MTKVTHLSSYAAAHPRALPAAAPQQPATITLQRALADGVTPAELRAVARWNERQSHDARYRPARTRHKAQSQALREVAESMEQFYVESYHEAA